jgi:hypothetical protein
LARLEKAYRKVFTIFNLRQKEIQKYSTGKY